jgi:uncharacterized tellurite resistance protein B-like protein
MESPRIRAAATLDRAMNDEDREAREARETVESAVEGVHGIIALGAILGSSAGDYVRDLAGSIQRLFGGGGLEAALREERARTKATLLALAVIADGAITDAERPALAEFAARHGLDADAVSAKVDKLAQELRDPRVLREKIAHVANELDANERLDVFVAVANLAHRGSRAWPEQEGYRGSAGPTKEALLAIFREGLGITSAGDAPRT